MINQKYIWGAIFAAFAALGLAEDNLQTVLNKAGFTSIVSSKTSCGDEIPARLFAASGRLEVWKFTTVFEESDYAPYHRVGYYQLGTQYTGIHWLVGGSKTGLPKVASQVIAGVFGLALDSGDHAGKGDTIYFSEPKCNNGVDQVKVLKTRIGKYIVPNDFLVAFEDFPFGKSDKDFTDDVLRLSGCPLPALAYDTFDFEKDTPKGPAINSSSLLAVDGAQFCNGGASVDVFGGLSPFLSQAYWKLFHMTFNPRPLAASKEGGIGTALWPDAELRNTPAHGADVLILQNFRAPFGYNPANLLIHMKSVDPKPQEGFLVYGIGIENGRRTATLLTHCDGNSKGEGWYLVGRPNFARYLGFAVTADNLCPSSVILGNGTQLISTAQNVYIP